MSIFRAVKHIVNLVVALVVVRLGGDCVESSLFSCVYPSLLFHMYAKLLSLKLKTLISSRLFLTTC